MNKYERKIIAFTAIETLGTDHVPARPITLRDRIFSMTKRRWAVADIHATLDELVKDGLIIVTTVPGGAERNYHEDKRITLALVKEVTS